MIASLRFEANASGGERYQRPAFQGSGDHLPQPGNAGKAKESCGQYGCRRQAATGGVSPKGAPGQSWSRLCFWPPDDSLPNCNENNPPLTRKKGKAKQLQALKISSGYFSESEEASSASRVPLPRSPSFNSFTLLPIALARPGSLDGPKISRTTPGWQRFPRANSHVVASHKIIIISATPDPHRLVTFAPGHKIQAPR